MNSNNQDNYYCPSYYAKPGAELFGIVSNSGFINYLKETIVIDQAFIEEANKTKAPEKRFRFAGNCAKSGCSQWSKGKSECGLVDKIIAIVGNAESKELQECPIRSKCRWFMQKKGLACVQCNEVIRNIEEQFLENA